MVDEIRNIDVVEQTETSVTVSALFDYGEFGMFQKRLTIPYVDEISIIRELRSAYRECRPAPAQDIVKLPKTLKASQ